MDAALAFLGLVWALLGRNRTRTAWPETSPPSSPSSPSSPEPLPPTSTPEWPQVVPPGLPPFPGSGWEFDEPPPAAVQQRARQLVDVLWKQGNGASKIEQTAGRWIAYQAQVVASGKKGVVAYREKRAAAPAAVRRAPAAQPAPRAPVLRPQAAPRPPVAPAPAPRPVAASQPALSYPPGAVHPGHAANQFPPPGAPGSPLSLPTLRYGRGLKPAAADRDVMLLQQRLGIAADGRFGSGTLKAVQDFQRRKGLVADGIVGPKTWGALFAVKAA